ncbi:TspO/MBR family protein [Polymorphobacter fuscus]|nr:TspO/MBR family protein [Polymorphobacter fuscus]
MTTIRTVSLVIGTGTASVIARLSKRRPVMTDMKRYGLSPKLAACLAVGVVIGALAVGSRASPSPANPQTRRWYDRLHKPGFTPPAPVFALAWPLIQTAQAYSGYRLLRAKSSPDRRTALALWGANQVGIAGWSEVFFGQRAPGWATAGSAVLEGSAIGLVAVGQRVDRRAATAGLPLVAWVGFATLLAEEIWRRNDTTG